MRHNVKRRLSISIWILILALVAVILAFPRWITIFYPQPHHDLVLAASCEYQIDPNLVFAIIRAESKYQTSAESPVGAKGLMQIMPETAAWIAEKQGIENFTADELHNPETNINFGCWYIASLNQEFDGQIPLIIAAYNAGHGKVQQWVNSGQWDGDPEQLDKIPFKETQLYVKNVLKNYEAYRAIYM